MFLENQIVFEINETCKDVAVYMFAFSFPGLAMKLAMALPVLGKLRLDDN